ncbi:cupin domain-containing protein [Reichenbachiella versicolor]|uniref:cupin domain-containing protein n=1 Tax=Reichenbachiella versicolor TaxID=1821036 RepID=UPI000D6E73FA|nr:cupin domain-containing protein [Reichenbachiella versicolor]
MTNKINEIVKTLDLLPHPEGGFYKETYRSSGIINPADLPDTITEERNYSTCIYFLLTSENFSAFHKINQDEIWHHYKGGRLTLHMISPEGVYSFVHIGKFISDGEVPQFVVPAGYYFAAEIPEKDSYALCGCTVSPGFDFRDFSMPTRDNMLKLYPEHQDIIARLSR